MICPLAVWAQLFQGDILVDGDKTTAEFVVMSKADKTCMIGSGRNACISQYSIGSVIIPATVEYDKETYAVKQVNTMAFRLCSKITSVAIPEGVTRVGDFAFVGCQSLAEVELPSTLTQVGTGAFINLVDNGVLKTVRCKATTPPRWECNDVFSFHKKGIGENVKKKIKATLYVPANTKAVYEDSRFSGEGWYMKWGWADFTAISEGHGATFRIKSKEDLFLFRDAVNNGVHFADVFLETDLDFTGDDRWEVNIGDTEEHAFSSNIGDGKSAVFDGQGHTIKGLRVDTDYSGLFGHVKGVTVKNLTLEKCYFYGTTAVGAVCAAAHGQTSVILESVYSKDNHLSAHQYSASLIGKSEYVSLNYCLCQGGKVKVYSNSDTSTENRWGGGLVGYSKEGFIYYCAVINHSVVTNDEDHTKIGAFIGGFLGERFHEVKHCYTTEPLGNPQNVEHNLTVYKGLEHTYINENGQSVKMTFNGDKNESMFCIGLLEPHYWVYCPGEYPLPYPFENQFPEPKPNIMTLRPRTMKTDRVNGLHLKEQMIWDYQKTFSDFSGGNSSFLSKEFQTSHLWIDDNLTDKVTQGMLPIGKATIDCLQGVRYDRKLTAKDEGPETIDIPVFKTDGENKLILDDDGQPIVERYETTETGDRMYSDVAYPIYLPYELTLPISCCVYKPLRVASDKDGVANIELQMVEDRTLAPYTPYYVTIDHGETSLGTTFRTIIKPKTSYDPGDPDLGSDYAFTGTLFPLTTDYVSSQKVYYQNTENYEEWKISTTSDAEHLKSVLPFRSYFQAKADKKSVIQLSLERVYDRDFVYEVIEGDEGFELIASEYKGDGGQVVVPYGVTAKVAGKERYMHVVDIGSNVFKEKGADILSIDLGGCDYLWGTWVDRGMDGNPFYGVNPTAVIFLPKDKGNKAPNVVLGDECQRLILKEGAAFQVPRNFKTLNVEYERSLPADGIYTICLPYSAPAQPGVKYYEASNYSSKMHFKEVETTEPGKPYLVVTTSAVSDFNYAGDNVYTPVVAKPADGKVGNSLTNFACGTFKTLSPAECVGKYFMQADGKQWLKVKEGNTTQYLSPFRAYLLFAPAVDWPVETFIEGTTGIEYIHTVNQDGTEQWYNLQGQPIDVPRQGAINITRGKKVVIKK